jgi:hypothetical protein
MIDFADFLDVAHQYCAFVETAHQHPLDERLVTFAALLSELYGAALRLPDQAEPDEKQNPPFEMPHQQWIGFEELTLYWQVPDPYEWEAPVISSLTDDLLGIYADIKRGLLILDQGDRDGAVWNWRSTLISHWGDLAVGALRALHKAMYK